MHLARNLETPSVFLNQGCICVISSHKSVQTVNPAGLGTQIALFARLDLGFEMVFIVQENDWSTC